MIKIAQVFALITWGSINLGVKTKYNLAPINGINKG